LVGWFNSSTIFAAVLIVEFVFGDCFCGFNNYKVSSLYFVFKYSAVLIISALFVALICNKPLPPHFVLYI
jgi:hypothetical protein